MRNDHNVSYHTCDEVKSSEMQEGGAAFEQVFTDVPYVLNMRTCSCNLNLYIASKIERVQCGVIVGHEFTARPSHPSGGSCYISKQCVSTLTT
jgi:hypothetical protein